MFHILNCGSDLLKSWLFQASLRNCLNCVHYCDDHSSLGNFFVEYLPKLIMNNQYFLHQRCCYYRNNTQRPALVNIFSSTSYCRFRLYVRFALFISASIIKGCLFLNYYCLMFFLQYCSSLFCRAFCEANFRDNFCPSVFPSNYALEKCFQGKRMSFLTGTT